MATRMTRLHLELPRSRRRATLARLRRSRPTQFQVLVPVAVGSSHENDEFELRAAIFVTETLARSARIVACHPDPSRAEGREDALLTLRPRAWARLTADLERLGDLYENAGDGALSVACGGLDYLDRGFEPACPELFDDYLFAAMNRASELPEEEQAPFLKSFPEWRHGFFRSALSKAFGHAIFVGQNAVLIPAKADPRAFMARWDGLSDCVESLKPTESPYRGAPHVSADEVAGDAITACLRAGRELFAPKRSRRAASTSRREGRWWRCSDPRHPALRFADDRFQLFAMLS